jgi:hypothetical protein
MLLRCLAVVAFAAIAGVTLAAIAPGTPAQHGVDFWNMPADSMRLSDLEAQAEDLERKRWEIDRQSRASRVVIRDWVMGQTTLAETAAELERINAGRIDASTLRFYAPPGTEDRALFAWFALNTVRSEARNDPSLSADLLLRLEEQYRALVASGADPRP